MRTLCRITRPGGANLLTIATADLGPMTLCFVWVGRSRRFSFLLVDATSTTPTAGKASW
jgi:hypothetical protein